MSITKSESNINRDKLPPATGSPKRPLFKLTHDLGTLGEAEEEVVVEDKVVEATGEIQESGMAARKMSLKLPALTVVAKATSQSTVRAPRSLGVTGVTTEGTAQDRPRKPLT